MSNLLVEKAGDTKVWLFIGEMGNGKTTLIKEICILKGVKESMCSPTFGIINEYQGQDKSSIYHFDFYRIRNASELLEIGIDEYLNSGCYCFIEWPEIAFNHIPQQHIKVHIGFIDRKTRSVYLERFMN